MSINSEYGHPAEGSVSSRQRSESDSDRRKRCDGRQLTGFTEYKNLQHRVRANQISSELRARFFNNEDLEESVLSAVHHLSKSLDQADVVAKLDTDPEEKDYTQVVVQVTAPYNDIEQYSEIKNQVRDIVRSAEVGNQMLYTRIHRMK